MKLVPNNGGSGTASARELLTPSELSIELALMDMFVSARQVNIALVEMGLLVRKRSRKGFAGLFDYRAGQGQHLAKVVTDTDKSRKLKWSKSTVILLSEYFRGHNNV